MARIVLFGAVLLMVLGAGEAMAQSSTAPSQTGTPAATGMLPARVEVGGYGSWADNGYGFWRGATAEVWLARNRRFIPAFFFDSQTRPAGTQQNYAFLSYMNWSKSFYTVQGVSGAPQRSDEAIYFPKIRYDVKGYWKLPPEKNFVLAAGYTHFDLGVPGHGQIYNAGALYYHKKCVVEANLYANQSQPGDFWSASGSLSVQYGMEGKYWFGVTASGGRELYRVEGLTPYDVRSMSYTLDLFYRRWITRHVGFTLGLIYQDKLEVYRRAGVSGKLFYEY